MMNKINLLGILLSAILLTSCNNQDTQKVFDYGQVENDKYVNSFFDFEITLPAKWNIRTKEQMDDITNKGKTLLAGDDAKMKATLNASEINSANLLSVSQYGRGSAVEFNPSFIIIAENVKNFPGIKTGSDYLFHSQKLLEQSQFKYDYCDTVFLKDIINGTDFYKMNSKTNYMGHDIKQISYSTVLKGFSFNIIIAFINDQQKNDLLKSINSMRFKK